MSAPLPVTAQDSLCDEMIPPLAAWQVIFSVVSTCLSARPTVKLSLRVGSRSDCIDAFMVKFTVSAAKAAADEARLNAAATRSDLIMGLPIPFPQMWLN